MVKILVVDDDARNLRLAVAALDQAGHEVVSADGGASGIEAAPAYAPDMILMDVQMPGMSGLEAIGRLRAAEATRALCIIAVTSYRSEFLEEDSSLSGADGYIAKPYHYANLIELARAVLASPRRGE